MYTEGLTSHLIRHLAGGYEYLVYVQVCDSLCQGPWEGGEVTG